MKYWKRTNPDGSIKTVESYSHSLDVEEAIEINKKEHDDFIASIPKPAPQPTRDLAAEIDVIKARLDMM